MRHYPFPNAAVELGGYEGACEFLAPIVQGLEVECFAAALCDTELKLLELVKVPGDATSVIVPVQTIMRRAVAVKATGLIVAHNHPSGALIPGRADIDMSKRLSLAADALDISLLDHLIFDGGPVFSFRRAGLI